MFAAELLLADVRTYGEAGNKQAGGPGDRWSADWTARRLADAGFAVSRQPFEVPWFNAAQCSLTVDDQAIPLVAQPLVVPTPETGLISRLALSELPGKLDGAIAIVRLPHRRWSSMTDKTVEGAIRDALERGAAAVILVTTGPSGEALLLNVQGRPPLQRCPLVLLAPRLAGPVIEAARRGKEARLVVSGAGGTRTAENVVGRIVRPGCRWIVVSTPRSGWTDCTGERGPGIAIWLALAGWAGRALPRHSLMFVSSSGHEYENLGAEHVVAAYGPPPDETDFWLHLGANAATRDWHETPAGLLPLPSADPNRFLVTSLDLVEASRRIFSGQPGIEMAYPSDRGTAGELSEIVKAGYRRHAGIFGAHRHHHAASDDFSTIAAGPLAATANGFRELLSQASVRAL